MKQFSKNVNHILGRAGFTLVELLVVMAILGILIAVAIAGIGIAQRGARDNTRIRDLTSLKGVLEDGYGSTKAYGTFAAPLSCSVSGATSIYVYLSNVSASCSSLSAAVKLQQGTNTSNILTQSSGICGASSTLGIADSSNSYIGYEKVSNSQYNLCSRLENGTLYQLGN